MFRKAKAILISLLLLVTGCSKPVPEISIAEETPKTYLIPNSLIEFTGMEVADYEESLNELGSEYVENAVKTDNGIEIQMTESQKDSFIKRQKGFLENCKERFLSHSDQYSIKNDNYRKISMYYDENIEDVSELLALVSIITYSGILQILETNDSDWKVEVNIYNCHTGSLVASGTFPGEGLEFGQDEWIASYE